MYETCYCLVGHVEKSIGLQIELGKLYLRISRINYESHIGLQPKEMARRKLDNPMASLQERLEAMCPRNGRGTTSQEEEIDSPVRGDVTNLLLLELLQK